MSERYLVDENVIIDFLLGKTELFNVFDNEENIYISSLSIGSLYEKAPKLIPAEDIAESCRDFCSQLNQIQIDEKIAKKYSVLSNLASVLGIKLTEKELWLAACAVVYDLVMISQSEELRKIPDLKLFYPN